MDCLNHTTHRPWPLPKGKHAWRQSWLDLAFFHWPVSADEIQKTLPAGLEVDTFDGSAWISVVPFRMEGVMKRGIPSLPGISNFPEMNLRTYVTCNGKPGVWFYSLDADQSIAVWAARKFFHLPYFKAGMKCESDREGVIHYSSARASGDASFQASYQPLGEAYHAVSGSLEEWLCERYCLYSASEAGDIYCGEVHHRQWPLQKIKYDIQSNEVATAAGITISGEPVSAQFSRELQVAVWNIFKCC